MSKKIIFVGPPGAGKTTLRKIFFEGENSTKLLEYALEPTYGEQSLILRLPGLNEDIGIFDLAGQENDRWLETEDRAIFHETQIILNVIDITMDYNEIIKFVGRIVDIRNILTPLTPIFVLLHKIDLVNQKTTRELKSMVKTSFSKENLIKFLFTSLKREFFTQTFSYFIKIMKTCLQEDISEEGLFFNMIDESLKIIHQIDKEVLTPRNTLFEKLNRPKKLVNYIIEGLIEKGHLETKRIENEDLLSLSDKGKEIYQNILNHYSSITCQPITRIFE